MACRPEDPVRLRVAMSPMATTMASLFEVVGGWRRGSNARWATAMRRRAADVDIAPLSLFAAGRVVPNSLVPIPDRPGPSFTEELASLRRVGDEDVRRDITSDFGHAPPPPYDAWIADPSGSLAAFIASLESWWAAVVEPEWPRMSAILETEILRLGRVLVTEGSRAAVGSIHPRVGWDGDRLLWTIPRGSARPRPLGDRELVLLPMACGPQGLMVSGDRERVVAISYGAPGAAALFQVEPVRADDALVAMLGKGRAATLRALDGASSMRTVAMRAGLAPSTVCGHLHALADMLLVHRGRVGRYVVYARTERGRRLVELF